MNRGWIAMLVLALAGSVAFGQEKPQWEVHDRKRPQPPVVTPGEPSTQEKAGTAPSDAIVLFDGKDLSAWQKEGGGEPAWKVEEGVIVIAPHTGAIRTKQDFGDVQLHIEWMIPEGISGEDQHRGNSGVFLMGQYEIQVLDNYKSETYPDGTAGGLYGQYPPQANVCRPPGQWQAYDIVFHPPASENGKVIKPATATVFFNGVLVQDNMKILGPTHHATMTSYGENTPNKGPVQLQDHGFPVRYRNVWARELKAKPAAAVKDSTEKH